MMEFSGHRPRRTRGENIVPMINVVFLLLIFFLMSAQIAPPDPVEVALPKSASEAEHPQSDNLYVSKDGTLYYNGVQGEAVWEQLADRSLPEPLFIRADQDAPATALASVLSKLARAGVEETLLVTGRE